MYHFRDWKLFGLQNVWFHNLGKVSPVHESVEKLHNIVELLPAMHCLSGCDTTSKMGTKYRAFQIVSKPEYSCLKEFGHNNLDDLMYKTAEHYLIECISRTENRREDSFDDLIKVF